LYWQDLAQKIYGKEEEDKSYWGNTCKKFKQILRDKYSTQSDLSNLCGGGNCKLINKEEV
jgi:hypothetical protein